MIIILDLHTDLPAVVGGLASLDIFDVVRSEKVSIDAATAAKFIIVINYESGTFRVMKSARPSIHDHICDLEGEFQTVVNEIIDFFTPLNG